MPLPRLTGALRAFSSVSAQDSDTGQNADLSSDLARRRQLAREEQAKEGLSWKKLNQLISKHAKADEKDVNAHLRQLLQAAKTLVGSDSDTGTVEGAAAFLVDTFKTTKTVGQRESSKLRSLFGHLPASAATSACDAVRKVVDLLPDYGLEELATPSVSDKKATVTGIEEFGKNIHFNADAQLETSFSDSETDDEYEEEANHEFDLRYGMGEDASQAAGLSYDGKWLQMEVAKSFSEDSGVSVLDICASVFDILSSARSDEEIQNELFELLGFDRFELILKLLEHRKDVIAATLSTGTDYMMAKSTGRKTDPSARPNYGCQVTIQSEGEKQLRKQLRREEKKMSKLDNKKLQEDEPLMQALGFDPEILRAQREQALITAATAPLFSQRSSRAPERIQYPNVFDSFAEAQQSSAFVGGSKMLLPEGFERVNCKMYEEVNLPASEKAPVNVGCQRVQISALDEIARLAFQGTDSLNRIQSVVFDTAYKTNENLLICAPTGAGKTNIAMLTILHEVKQHIDQGVIKKDEFKVVYVAPMKALAAEMVRNFGKRLQPLGITVKELTGDMQLTKQEIMQTQMLVTTPEKWDVVTRKSTGDVALSQLVKLLIIDEVHLLHDDRGSVIESLVARTLRQ
ncbi:activating signal cointegrator 1 complex subunit 3-like, partial [Lingula anatina]|uniref:Activating signal cointegrator 1 complex subunit 3-like n=1 Tax=Lingula anatina TaxID=7574 RepID=A0A1S3HVU5_LINAN